MDWTMKFHHSYILAFAKQFEEGDGADVAEHGLNNPGKTLFSYASSPFKSTLHTVQ
jgi:hypothetical protein